MKKILSIVLNTIFSLFPIKENKILFESGRGKVDDNPLAIYEYIKENKIDNLKTIWLVNKKTNIKLIKEGNFAYYRTLKGYYHAATAKYLIRSQSVGSLLKKRKGQICLYADHGSYGLKKCGYDTDNSKERPRKKYTYDWDFYISSSKYNSKINRSATGYDGKSLDLGLARSDKLVNVDQKRVLRIKKDLGILKNKKPVILYAPTFREKDIESGIPSYKIDKLLNLKDFCVIITVHPLAKDVMKKIDLGDYAIDAIDYEINDLLLVTDILITDYSSVIFDYSLLKKPMVFYPYDYEEYAKIRGGFYLNYKKDLPGPIAYNEDQLISILKDKKKLLSYKDKIEVFNKKYNESNDGNVCKRIVDMILNDEFKEV